MELAIILGGILFTFGYIFFSSPGDKLRKKHSLFNSSLKSDSKEDENALKYLKENGIEPCFLQSDLKNVSENKCESYTSGVKKTPLTNHHQLQMIILNSYNNQNKDKDNDTDTGYSMRLRKK